MKENSSSFRILLILLGVVMVAVIGFSFFKNSEYSDPRPKISILFVGDIYTATNDMPQMLEEIALSDPTSGYIIKTKNITQRDATLEDLWLDKNSRSITINTAWHYIVLQPQKNWMITKSGTLATNKAIENWINTGNEVKSIPVLFMAWPTQQNTEQLYPKIKAYSKVVAQRHKMLMAPIADYWYYMQVYHPEIPLYAEDGDAPSVHGSYFTALIFYKTLTGLPLKNITYAPPEITPAQRNLMISIAEKNLQ